MADVKALKLLVNLRLDSVKVYQAGEYRDNIPKALIDEFKNGSRHIVELADVPSVKASAPPISQEETVQKKKTPPRTGAKKVPAKSKTGPRK